MTEEQIVDAKFVSSSSRIPHISIWHLPLNVQKRKDPHCKVRAVWYDSLTIHFQFLNNITHFFTHTYFKKIQTSSLEQHYQTTPRIFKKQKNNNCKANNLLYWFTKEKESFFFFFFMEKKRNLMYWLAKTNFGIDLLKLFGSNFPKICFSILE